MNIKISQLDELVAMSVRLDGLAREYQRNPRFSVRLWRAFVELRAAVDIARQQAEWAAGLDALADWKEA